VQTCNVADLQCGGYHEPSLSPSPVIRSAPRGLLHDGSVGRPSERSPFAPPDASANARRTRSMSKR